MAQIKLENGKTYDLPERFSLGEMRIVERYASGHLAEGGYTLAQVSGAIHVAIARVEKGLSFEEIQEVVDEIDMESLEKALDEAPQSPPAESNSESNGSSSDSSEPVSDASPESETPEPSGSQPLPTGFHSFHGISTS